MDVESVQIATTRRLRHHQVALLVHQVALLVQRNGKGAANVNHMELDASSAYLHTCFKKNNLVNHASLVVSIWLNARGVDHRHTASSMIAHGTGETKKSTNMK